MTFRQHVVPGLLVFPILVVIVMLIQGCQQPFYLPYGTKLCPEGQHSRFDQKRGWICVPDSTPPDSTP